MISERAFEALAAFSDQGLTQALSNIEKSLVGATGDDCGPLLAKHNARSETLVAASRVKQLSGQINVTIHALGIMLCLPRLLNPGEKIEYTSLGAGNTGKSFDLETNQRVAEFKFIDWRGGAESIRQNSLFKDFYGLANYETKKTKHLYVLGTEIPLRFMNGNRAIDSVLSKNVKLDQEFKIKHPNCRVVCDYYKPRSEAVQIEDISPYLPELVLGEKA